MEIELHLTRTSRRYAARVVAGIDRISERLARFPLTGRPCPELAPGLRRRATREGYVIYFVPTAGGIEVQRVLHGSRHVDPSMFDL